MVVITRVAMTVLWTRFVLNLSRSWDPFGAQGEVQDGL